MRSWLSPSLSAWPGSCCKVVPQDRSWPHVNPLRISEVDPKKSLQSFPPPVSHYLEQRHHSEDLHLLHHCQGQGNEIHPLQNLKKMQLSDENGLILKIILWFYRIQQKGFQCLMTFCICRNSTWKYWYAFTIIMRHMSPDLIFRAGLSRNAESRGLLMIFFSSLTNPSTSRLMERNLWSSCRWIQKFSLFSSVTTRMCSTLCPFLNEIRSWPSSFILRR